MINPKPETVEQFLARGGVIQQIAPDVRAKDEDDINELSRLVFGAAPDAIRGRAQKRADENDIFGDES